MVRGRLPGVVIDQDFGQATAVTRDFPRFAGFIAKAPPIKLFQGQQVVRGQLEGVLLTFSSVSYTAPLIHLAIPDKTRARMYTSDGRTVPPARWAFSESVPGSQEYDLVSLDPVLYSNTVTYSLDYISIDPDVLDEVPVEDIREMLRCGDTAAQARYIEGRDYFFQTTSANPIPGASNAVPPAPLTAITKQNAGVTGTFAHVSNTFSHDYNRNYVMRCTAASGLSGSYLATFVVTSMPTSGGFGSAPPEEFTVNLSEAVPAVTVLDFGVTIQATFGAANFSTSDVFTFNGVGDAVLEIADAMQNTNQFSEFGTPVVDATGEGSISVNPQSNYEGTENQVYVLTATQVVASGANRSASFAWKAKPLLKTLTGLVTATNASTAVTGSGTQFLTEVAIGDLVYFGNTQFPAEVSAVLSNTSMTLLTAFTGTTVTSQPALRIREVAGSLGTVVASGTVNRLEVQAGLYVDIDFGTDPDNFDTGDTFTIAALAARKNYNGKENRAYAIAVTDASLAHQVTMSYSGNTPDSGFGSHVFQEGSGLALPNNTVVYARNLSVVKYYSDTPADTFDMTLTFDGVIDWRLRQRRSETFTASSILRDLTGERTGVVGAYFYLLKSVPLAVEYVRGPAPTYANIVYNQYGATNIIYFLTNPGVNVTIAYQYAGLEPRAGASYFLTGYRQRPDSDYDMPQVFLTRDSATAFCAPMTTTNDAAIANEIAWDQDEASLPGVVIMLVKDADGDGTYTDQDYEAAIQVSEQFRPLCDLVTVNQFAVRDTFKNSIVNMNDSLVSNYRIGYLGFPVNFPIGDSFTPDTRIYTSLREMQIEERTAARGTIAIIGNTWAKKVIRVDSLGDGDVDAIDTEVTLDGSFLAVGLAARVSSFAQPWETILQLSLVGFSEVEPLTTSQMIQLKDAGIIPLQVSGSSVTYAESITPDTTEVSTNELSGTVQRQYFFSRLKARLDETIGIVFDTPQDLAVYLQNEGLLELRAMISERKIARMQDAAGAPRPVNSTDFVAFRDPRDPRQSYFRTHGFLKYANKYCDGLVRFDGPVP